MKDYSGVDNPPNIQPSEAAKAGDRRMYQKTPRDRGFAGETEKHIARSEADKGKGK
jgi:hypothetical protein